MGALTRAGYSSYVRPCSNLPAFFFLTPPHCLKKNGTRDAAHWSRIAMTHSSHIGRAPGPLSPPTMDQLIPERSNGPRSSSSGSIERNRTRAGADCKCLILGRPCVLSSTLTPHQMCSCFAANRNRLLSSSRSRADRFVRTWNVCQFARAMTRQTVSM